MIVQSLKKINDSVFEPKNMWTEFSCCNQKDFSSRSITNCSGNIRKMKKITDQTKMKQEIKSYSNIFRVFLLSESTIILSQHFSLWEHLFFQQSGRIILDQTPREFHFLIQRATFIGLEWALCSLVGELIRSLFFVFWILEASLFKSQCWSPIISLAASSSILFDVSYS